MSWSIKKLLIGLTALCFMINLGSADTATALGLKVTPLEYKTSLHKGERKQGVIDVSNPSHQTVKVSVSVQAFRQISDQGGLQFYDDKQIQLGITPGLKDFELGPREAVRIQFLLDSANLPKGDVYAAIFLTTETKQPRTGVGQLVRVGTLLSIVNQSAGNRKAEITDVTLPVLQLSSSVKGKYQIRNTGASTSGFYPAVTITSWPNGKPVQRDGSLVFGGRERSNDFSYDAGVGLHFIEVGYGDSKKGQWVLALPAWLLVVVGLVGIIIWIELLLYRKRRRQANKAKSQTKGHHVKS